MFPPHSLLSCRWESYVIHTASLIGHSGSDTMRHPTHLEETQEELSQPNLVRKTHTRSDTGQSCLFTLSLAHIHLFPHSFTISPMQIGPSVRFIHAFNQYSRCTRNFGKCSHCDARRLQQVPPSIGATNSLVTARWRVQVTSLPGVSGMCMQWTAAFHIASSEPTPVSLPSRAFVQELNYFSLSVKSQLKSL